MKIFFASVCLLVAAGLAAQDDLIPAAKPKSVISMAPAPLVAVVPGKVARVELQFRVAPGYHINSNKPNSEYLIPTALKLDAQTGLALSKVTYPPGEDLTFSFSPKDKLNVYAGDFAISAQVSAALGTPLGRYRIHGRLISQACDNRQCYAPKTLPVAFDVQVRKAASVHSRRNPAQSPHIRH